MILTCELCQSQFLTESDPHVIIPGLETKIYCYCQVKGDGDQRWIDQLKHEHKLYQKHLSGLKAENERLEAENKKLRESLKFTTSAAEYLFKPDVNLEKGMNPTFYFTLNYEGDLALIEKTKRAIELLKELEDK